MIIIGGAWGKIKKESSIINILAKELKANVVNGGNDINEYTNIKEDTCIWMPNILNEEEKHYPLKPRGGTLICSKVLRFENGEDNAITEAISRIFTMHANAVIAIDKRSERMRFLFIDALGNTWIDTDDIKELSKCINRFISWSKGQIRHRSIQITSLQWLCEINKKIAAKVSNRTGKRFFGNSSTRCSLLFPSTREDEYVFVSKRNINKQEISVADFVRCKKIKDTVFYEGKDKPSVDAPIQLEIYKNRPEINLMIHGHAYVNYAPFTEHYYPCGDMREVEEILKVNANIINLKNHGFLIMANNASELHNIAESVEFIDKNVK